MTLSSLRPALVGFADAVAARFAFLHRSSEAAALAVARARVDTRQWNADLLKQLEWRRFEELCEAYYQALGFTTSIDSIDAEGGVDIFVHAQGAAFGASIVRCKPWDAYRVGIKAVKELRAAMTSANIDDAVLLTSGRFTQAAVDLGGKYKIAMIDGPGLLEKFAFLPAEQSAALLKLATQGDFLTPTCPRCSVKMASRQSTRGGRKYWGCRNYPQCKETIFTTGPG